MKNGRRRRFVQIAGLLVLAVAVAHGEPKAPFELRVVDAVGGPVLGLPVGLHMELVNVSADPQLVPGLSCRMQVEVVHAPDDAWNWLRKDPKLQKRRKVVWDALSKTLAPSERIPLTAGFQPPVPGKYVMRVRVTFAESGYGPLLLGEPGQHWVGELSTGEYSFDIQEPTGVDAEAFRAVTDRFPKNLDWSPAARFNMGPYPGQPTGALEILLTRYRSSIYAAYEIYRHYRDKMIMSAESASLECLERYRKRGYGFRSFCGSSWCDDDGRIEGFDGKGTELCGEAYVRCRDQWLSVALRHHPDLWFVQEMNLWLAADQYILGDIQACQVRLKEVASQARPYVAAKARELLAAMRAKEMLPGGAVVGGDGS